MALGIVHGEAVLDWVLKRLVPGEVPHYFVVKTLGDLAVANRARRRALGGTGPLTRAHVRQPPTPCRT